MIQMNYKCFFGTKRRIWELSLIIEVGDYASLLSIACIQIGHVQSIYKLFYLCKIYKIGKLFF